MFDIDVRFFTPLRSVQNDRGDVKCSHALVDLLFFRFIHSERT